MAIICPTVNVDVNVFNDYFSQVSRFSRRIHIDIMDGSLTDKESISLKDIKIPDNHQVDVHLMVSEPMNYLDDLIRLRPHLVIVHNEANVHHMYFAALLHQNDILAGLALVQSTPVDYTKQIMHSFDHILIFSGNLGYNGGTADLSLISKVEEVIDFHPGVEIGWDGGISDKNLVDLASSGVDILNVGSFIHDSENPQQAYGKLEGLL